MLGLTLFSLLTGCTASTEATQVGVRTVNLSVIGGRGIQDEIYPQGQTYFFFRPLSEWTLYDVGLRNLEMFRNPSQGNRAGDDSVRFKTFDGNDVSVDVTVVWSLDPSKAPHVLAKVGQSTDEVEAKLVRPVARSVVRDVLNELSSEAYYQADQRYQAADKARTALNEMLAEEGVHVEQILLGEHKFNDTYEAIIKDKKVAEQESARLVSQTQAAAEEMKRDLERAKGEVNQTIEQARGEAEKRKLEADAIYYERERQAAAILAEKKANAEGLQARARALAGAGGKAMVKLEVARALNGKKIIFVPSGGGTDLRTTDMNDLLQTYGAIALSNRQAPTP
ncbi:MAG: prohibitin family protein [Alphaproteobacteria bacterium]|nr:prohibitin family protein [Alphaproteobacteria bacterium]MCB9695254.1 prohibitin family protein [Alphaproteobacteria bacterium]